MDSSWFLTLRYSNSTDIYTRFLTYANDTNKFPVESLSIIETRLKSQRKEIKLVDELLKVYSRCLKLLLKSKSEPLWRLRFCRWLATYEEMEEKKRFTKKRFTEKRFTEAFRNIDFNGLNVEVNNGTLYCEEISVVAAAAFRISLKARHEIENCENLIKHVLSLENVPLKAQMDICNYLCEMCKVLNKQQLVKEDSKTLILFLKVAWSCVAQKCKMPKESIGEFFEQICEQTHRMLKRLRSYDPSKVNGLIKECLHYWSVAVESCKMLSAPRKLVEFWVWHNHIEYLKKKKKEAATTLNVLLPSSAEPLIVYKILMEELKTYQELRKRFPETCLETQENIIDILLKNDVVNNTREEKAELFLQKGMLLWADGKRLDKCNEFLSNVIPIMNKMCVEMSHTSLSNQRDRAYSLRALCIQDAEARAYSLRALCTQDAKTNSKRVDDIKAALELWIDMTSDSAAEDIVYRNSMPTLLNLLDLLSLKGFFTLHDDIIELIIKLLEWKKGSKMCSAILRDSRRLTHSLCGSSVSRSLRQPRTTSKDIKSAASKLEKDGERSERRLFLLSCHYYDLCERLIMKGELLEGLSFASRALELRYELHERFFYSSEESKVHELLHPVDFWASDDYCFTPWMVLQSYLESLLQHGVINELVGDEKKAQESLLEGKNISFTHKFSQFIVSFSSILGKIYVNRKLKEKAKAEIAIDGQIVKARIESLTCRKCKSILEATLYNRMFDFYQFCLNHDKKIGLAERQKYTGMAEEKRQKYLGMAEEERQKYSRMAEEYYNLTLDLPKLLGCKPNTDLAFKDEKGKSLQEKPFDSFGCIKQEYICKQLLLEALICKGVYLGDSDQIHEAYEIMLESINILFGKNFLFCSDNASVTSTSLLESIGKETLEHTFTIEHASILYNICWLYLKSRQTNGISNICCDLSCLEPKQIVSWLKLAFVRSCEVPALYQKVSKLLAILYKISERNDNFSQLSAGEKLSGKRKLCGKQKLSGKHWASFFHQASIGASYNFQFLSNLKNRCKIQDSIEAFRLYKRNLKRVFPSSIDNLEAFVKEFFDELNCNAVVCISYLGDAYYSLLPELLDYGTEIASNSSGWLMLSRLRYGDEPIVELQPVRQGEDDVNRCIDDGEDWYYPWGSSEVIDRLAPAFKWVIKENQYRENPETLAEMSDHLYQFLRILEDSWLGSSKDMLLLDSKEDNVDREPIILVLDFDLQMLPWECLPIFKDREIYRMFSVFSIAVAKDEHPRRLDTPSFDPLDACYLLDPTPKFRNVRVELGKRFKKLNFKEIIGPDAEGLSEGLQTHDLYIYFSHGNGSHYMSLEDTSQLKTCASAVLIGCSSGSIFLNGDYFPTGAPISYLLGGSRFVVANLWPVRKCAMVRFLKALLNGWIKETTNIGHKERRIGLFMATARAECKRGDLTWAAPVCFGIPTEIRKNENKKMKIKK